MVVKYGHSVVLYIREVGQNYIRRGKLTVMNMINKTKDLGCCRPDKYRKSRGLLACLMTCAIACGAVFGAALTVGAEPEDTVTEPVESAVVNDTVPAEESPADYIELEEPALPQYSEEEYTAESEPRYNTDTPNEEDYTYEEPDDSSTVYYAPEEYYTNDDYVDTYSDQTTEYEETETAAPESSAANDVSSKIAAASVDTSELTSKDWKELQDSLNSSLGLTSDDPGKKSSSGDGSHDNAIRQIKENSEDSQGAVNDTWIYLVVGIALILAGAVVVFVLILTTVRTKNKMRMQATKYRKKNDMEDILSNENIEKRKNRTEDSNEKKTAEDSKTNVSSGVNAVKKQKAQTLKSNTFSNDEIEDIFSDNSIEKAQRSKRSTVSKPSSGGKYSAGKKGK